jgi:hypothetical protein
VKVTVHVSNSRELLLYSSDFEVDFTGTGEEVALVERFELDIPALAVGRKKVTFEIEFDPVEMLALVGRKDP